MDILLYIIIFIMGTVFGSFFTLAVYRIPKRQDITHTHSYCPNCNHKLGFLDLIPVFSYIFLRGKCRYCKQKIRPRYFILEILSGLLFLLLAFLMNITIENLHTTLILDAMFMVLYLCFIFIMAGIDKEYRKIDKSVSAYGIIISIMYIVYLCIVENTNIYRYIIYLIFFILILILDNITLKKYAKNSYLNGLVLTLLTMSIFTGEYIAINTVIYTLLMLAMLILIHKIINLSNRNKKTEKKIWNTLPVGFYMAVANILNLIAVLSCYKILL